MDDLVTFAGAVVAILGAIGAILASINVIIKQQSKRIDSLERRLSEAEEKLKKYAEENGNLELEIKRLRSDCADKDRANAELKEIIATRDRTVAGRDLTITALEGRVETLHRVIKDLGLNEKTQA